MSMVCNGISSMIVKLINKPHRKRPYYPNRQSRNKIFPRDVIGGVWPYQIRNNIDQYQQNRCNNEIA